MNKFEQILLMYDKGDKDNNYFLYKFNLILNQLVHLEVTDDSNFYTGWSGTDLNRVIYSDVSSRS